MPLLNNGIDSVKSEGFTGNFWRYFVDGICSQKSTEFKSIMPRQTSLFTDAMSWFFCSEKNFDRDSIREGTGTANLIRFLIEHFDYALQKTANDKYASGKKETLRATWPGYLKKITGQRLNKEKNELRNGPSEKTFTKLDLVYVRSNEKEHLSSNVKSAELLENYLTCLPDLIHWIKDDHKDAFWASVTSEEACKSTQNLSAFHDKFLLLEVIRYAELYPQVPQKIDAWVDQQSIFKKWDGKILGEEKTWKTNLSGFLDKIMESENPFGTILNLVDEIGLPNKELFKSYHSELKKSAEDEGKNLPDVVHWTLCGDDVSSLELTVQKGSRSETPIEGPLLKLLQDAIKLTKNLRAEKPLLQVEFEQNLFFDIQSAIEGDLKNRFSHVVLKNFVSGIVFCPLRSLEWLEVVPSEQGGSLENWYGIEKLDPDSNLWNCEERSIRELGEWIAKNDLLHVYLEDFEANHKNWESIFDAFASCIFFGLATKKQIFEKLEAGSVGRVMKLESLAKKLKDLQIEDFGSAPKVFWQHEDRKSTFAKNREKQAEYV